MRVSFSTVLPVLALASSTFAQTFSDCNPTYGTCPPDPALGKSKTIEFSGGASDDFNALNSGSLTYDSNGAAFTVAKSGDSPTLVSKWYIMFGHVEFVVKAAPGAGIVSSAFLQSDCLDEIDWEWLGGDNSQVQSNYFAKGAGSGSRGGFHAASNNHDEFHTYTLDWTTEQIVWQVDGVTVRAVTASDAGTDYPQTPMHVRLGAWAGGDPSTNEPGTVAWAGGPVDWSAGPFTMYIKSISVSDYSTGSQYTYSDTSGTWQSIRSQGGTINAGGSASPVASEDAPGVTNPVMQTAPPLGFNPSNSDTAYETRTGYPWILDSATASAVTATPPPSGSWPPASSSDSPLPSGPSSTGVPTTVLLTQGPNTTSQLPSSAVSSAPASSGEPFPPASSESGSSVQDNSATPITISTGQTALTSAESSDPTASPSASAAPAAPAADGAGRLERGVGMFALFAAIVAA